MHTAVTCLFFLCLIGLTLADINPDGYDYYGGSYIPQPYNFGYKITDKEGQQYREEQSDGKGGVRGSYGFTDARGIYRQVIYVADALGFRAKVMTNEPGTANQNSAGVIMESEQM